MKREKERLQDMVQTGKVVVKRVRPKTLFSFSLPACIQNTLDVDEWKEGDPNDETTPEYDLIWLIWVLKQLYLPKDVITHFINLNGGFNFVLYRSTQCKAGVLFSPRLELVFWKESNMSLYGGGRQIYFNIPVKKKEKNRTYIYHIDGRTFIDNS